MSLLHLMDSESVKLKRGMLPFFQILDFLCSLGVHEAFIEELEKQKVNLFQFCSYGNNGVQNR